MINKHLIDNQKYKQLNRSQKIFLKVKIVYKIRDLITRHRGAPTENKQDYSEATPTQQRSQKITY